LTKCSTYRSSKGLTAWVLLPDLSKTSSENYRATIQPLLSLDFSRRSGIRMKRALAERAKQSGLPNGVGMTTSSSIQGMSLPTPAAPTSSGYSSASARSNGPGATTSSNAAPQRPVDSNLQVTSSAHQSTKETKLQIEKPSSMLTSSSKTTKKTNPTKSSRSPRSTSASSPRPKKRARESLVKLEEEDEDDSNATSFYLRHQNRALASELRAVKYQLTRLEREREHRRKQCLQAVEFLNTLNAMWGKVESDLIHQRNPKSSEIRNIANIQIRESDAPLSTGSGKSVEWIGALINSLTRIGTAMGSSKNNKRGENGDNKVKHEGIKSEDGNDNKMDVDGVSNDLDEEDVVDQSNMNDILNFSENISERVRVLQGWIWSLLQSIEKSNLPLNGDLKGQIVSPPSSMALQEQISRVESQNITLQEHVTELARSRDEVIESDRRVRRGLYRLAARRVNLKEVLKAVANADEDKESAAVWMESNVGSNDSGTSLSASASGSEVASSAKVDKKEGEHPTSSKEFEQLKKQIADLNTLASSRDEKIKKLLSEKEEQTKRINTLVLKEDKTASDIPTNEEVKRSDLYFELTAKLAETTRSIEELNEKSNLIQKEWSTALADAEFSRKTMEEMQANFTKRWKELTEEKPNAGDTAGGEGELSRTSTAKEIMMLQHKLTQAIENVRQAETTRQTLDEAVAMNNSLQSKVDEFKAKYNTLQAEKAARGSSNQHSNSSSTPSKELSSASKSKSSSYSTPMEKGDRSMEKLQREYKRARKELAATTASKDAAKAKLERTEKEKEHLSQMNSRLLKQASEKDEMNAKSLSTILHLKQLTEQITKEKENLEQQVKSAGQLALAARLASNARERVAEEFANEQKVLKRQLEELENKCSILAKEKVHAEGKLSQEKARMSGLISDAMKAKTRCEELAVKSTKLEQEKQKITESLAIAKREASEATNLSQKLANCKGGGMVAGFTAEQLNTQVSHLKSRLACPVCNVRDKKVILLRCRHMFCKQCVDENVKNRSRKCPACGLKFDTKDIADVYL